MPLDPRIVARKLKQARELQSLGVQTVSEATGIEVERIALVETGESPTTGDEVLILANYYRQHLGDADHDDVICEHELYETRPLPRFFREAFEAAMRCRLLERPTATGGATEST